MIIFETIKDKKIGMRPGQIEFVEEHPEDPSLTVLTVQGSGKKGKPGFLVIKHPVVEVVEAISKATPW